MAYSFLRIEKIKTMGSMVSKYNHNYRKEEIDNVIPGMEHKNDDLVPLPEKADGTGMDYAEAFRDRIASLPYYKSHRIRSDQVKAYEVLLSYSKDEGVDVEQWKAQSVKWLHDTFDRAGDGRSNVLSAIYHGDETGNGHIHAIVVPIDERGRLNASRFTNGHRQMSGMQESYAQAVKDLGIDRGLAGSSAHHKTIRKVYADLNNAKNSVPDLLPGESAQEYKARIIEEAETLYISGKRKADDYMVNARRNADAWRMGRIEEAKEETERTRKAAAAGLKDTEAKRDAARTALDAYREEMDALAQQMYEMKIRTGMTDGDLEDAVEAKRIRAGIGLIRAEDPERAAVIEEGIGEAVGRALEQEAEISMEERGD